MHNSGLIIEMMIMATPNENMMMMMMGIVVVVTRDDEWAQSERFWNSCESGAGEMQSNCCQVTKKITEKIQPDGEVSYRSIQTNDCIMEAKVFKGTRGKLYST